MNSIPHISICICTYRRPALLEPILHSLAKLETRGLFSFSVVVADNDREQSGRSVVEKVQREEAIEIKYCVEPEQNIALARNRALANARGDFVAFIDDDEFPVSDWLVQLFLSCKAHESAGVLGPVRPRFEHEPPQWVVKGRFCDRPEHLTGKVLGWTETRTGNVLLRRSILEGIPEPFRREFGSGSEDTDFFQRMIAAGHRFTWCNEAPVHEVIPAERWRRGYLVRRALLRGQNKRHMAGFGSVAKSCLAVGIYSMALPVLFLSGQHRFMRYLVSLCDHLGKLAGVLGFTPMGEKYLNPTRGTVVPALHLDTTKA